MNSNDIAGEPLPGKIFEVTNRETGATEHAVGAANLFHGFISRDGSPHFDDLAIGETTEGRIVGERYRGRNGKIVDKVFRVKRVQ